MDTPGTQTPDKTKSETRKRAAPDKSGACRVCFSPPQRAAIHTALRDELRIHDADLRGKILDEISATGAIRTFGYGSLIHTPHAPVDSITAARLKGWAKGFVCYDPFYRGTWSDPGLTLGLERDADRHTDGAMLENRFENSGACPARFTEMLVDYIRLLAKREMPVDAPFYHFHLLTVTLDSGKRHKALACVADTASRLYVGRQMTLEERAQIIARSYGYGAAQTRGKGARLSNLDYIRKCIHANLEMGDDPCPRMMKLLRLANAARRELDAEERADLDSLEKPGYHPSVYL